MTNIVGGVLLVVVATAFLIEFFRDTREYDMQKYGSTDPLDGPDDDEG